MFKTIVGLFLAIALVATPVAVGTAVNNAEPAVNAEFYELNTGRSLDEFEAEVDSNTSVGSVFSWFGIDLNDVYAKGGVTEADMPFSNNDSIIEAGSKSADYMAEQTNWAIGIFSDLPGFLGDLYDGNDTYQYPEAWLNSPYAIH